MTVLLNPANLTDAVPLDHIRGEWSERGGLLIPRRQGPTGVDLFCGCGGFSLGCIQAGVEVVAALDNDPASAVTYMLNLCSHPVEVHYAEPADKDRLDAYLTKEFKRTGKGKFLGAFTSGSGWIAGHPEAQPVRHFFFGDVRKFSGADILGAVGLQAGEVGIVFGGPPCQGFSRAGKRNVMDPRNSLVFEFARLVLEMRPHSLIMENVPDIATMVTPEGLPVLDVLARMLEQGGMGAMEALRRALGANPKARGAILGASRKPKASHRPKPPAVEDKGEQLDLLGASL